VPTAHCAALGAHPEPSGVLYAAPQGAHWASEVAALTALKVPRGHCRQADGDVAPAVGPYLPAAQGMQVVVPLAAQYPAAQHTLAPGTEPVLRGQGRHAKDAEAPVEAL